MRRLLLLALAGAASCAKSSDAAKSEADRMSRAVTELRDAPNDAKPQRLKALTAVGCEEDDVCALQAFCARAYEKHVAALEATRAVGREIDADAGSGLQAAALLRQAETQLEEARGLAGQCADRQADLDRKYGL